MSTVMSARITNDWLYGKLIFLDHFEEQCNCRTSIRAALATRSALFERVPCFWQLEGLWKRLQPIARQLENVLPGLIEKIDHRWFRFFTTHNFLSWRAIHPTYTDLSELKATIVMSCPKAKGVDFVQLLILSFEMASIDFTWSGISSKIYSTEKCSECLPFCVTFLELLLHTHDGLYYARLRNLGLSCTVQSQMTLYRILVFYETPLFPDLEDCSASFHFRSDV